jgi:hypothetical protein
LEEAEKWLRKAISLMEPKGPSAILETLKRNLGALLKGRQLQTLPKSENPNAPTKAVGVVRDPPLLEVPKSESPDSATEPL